MRASPEEPRCQVQISVTLEEAYLGTSQQLRIRSRVGNKSSNAAGLPMTLVDSFRRLSCSSCQGRGASVLCASCEVRLGMGCPTVTTLLLRIATCARELGHFHHFFVTPRDWSHVITWNISTGLRSFYSSSCWAWLCTPGVACINSFFFVHCLIHWKKTYSPFWIQRSSLEAV